MTSACLMSAGLVKREKEKSGDVSLPVMSAGLVKREKEKSGDVSLDSAT